MKSVVLSALMVLGVAANAADPGDQDFEQTTFVRCVSPKEKNVSLRVTSFLRPDNVEIFIAVREDDKVVLRDLVRSHTYSSANTEIYEGDDLKLTIRPSIVGTINTAILESRSTEVPADIFHCSLLK